jgi:O-methyltransferase
MKRVIKRVVHSLGYDVVRREDEPEHNQAPQSNASGENQESFADIAAKYPDLTEDQINTIIAVRPFTMTSVERLISLIHSVEYIHARGIKGDIVECGVWRGGSMMAAALTLMRLGDCSRDLYLYDTFEGMSAPTEIDKAHNGQSADELLRAEERGTGIWCYADLEDVQNNLRSIKYPADKIHFVRGKVEDTIPGTLPSGDVAILRLDTDWYSSTLHEMVHLYPLLAPEGVLIIDDYGHWEGARQAVDEYLAANRISLLLHRVDYTGRIALKPRP